MQVWPFSAKIDAATRRNGEFSCYSKKSLICPLYKSNKALNLIIGGYQNKVCLSRCRRTRKKLQVIHSIRWLIFVSASPRLRLPASYPQAYSLLLNAFNLGSYPTQLLFQPFISPIEVIDSRYLGNAFGGQPGQDQRGTGPEIRGHHRGTLQF